MLDLFIIRTEQEFFETYAAEVLKAVSTRPDEMLTHVKSFFRALIPKVTFSADSINDISLSFDFAEIKKNRNEILDIVEKLAQKKKCKIIFCIDEFQNVES